MEETSSAAVQAANASGQSGLLARSISIRDLRAHFADKGKVSSFDLVNFLFERHPTYLDNRAASLRVHPTVEARLQTVDDWLEEAETLFAPLGDLVIYFDTRLLILSLAVLDQQLRESLGPENLELLDRESQRERGDSTPFEKLVVHRTETVDVPPEAARDATAARNDQRGDNVPLLPDQPTDDDQLGRAYFARALAIRIRRVWKEEVGKGPGNFLLHVHGPWGSGKSSVLKLLAKQLKKTEPPKRPEESEESIESKLSRGPWMIVEFNAWQHQRIAPPWWWLMRAVYTEGLRRHPLKLRIWEYAWRLRISFSPYLGLLIAALLFLLVALATGLLQGLMRTPLAVLGQGVKSITDILALLLGLSGIILGLSRLLVLGSARSASSFLETAKDPMEAIRRHYMGLIRRTGPVAIFIDDLDRCRSEYVVALLEGIQTLFREAPAVYVVVAERRWLQSCYETAYSTFDDRVADPGRSLGSLFLEKTFQLSTSVPRMSDTIQKAYWQRLLLSGKGNAQKDLQDARLRAEGSLAGLTKNQISARLAAVQPGTADEQALREVAVVRSAEDDVTEETERMLGAFGPLLEPNPRAMKRLVNAFGVQRDIAIFAGVKTADNELALWTIANLRWPLLTEQLERNPDLVSHILDGTEPADGQLSGIRPLFQDPDVVRVFGGKEIGVALTPERIRKLAGLRTSDSSASGVG